MGPPGTFIFSQSSSANGITKSQLTQIRNAVGSDGAVIPIMSNSTQYIINSLPGRGSLYALDPNDIPKFLTVADGTNIVNDNDALVGATIAANFDVKPGRGSSSGRLPTPPSRSSGLPGSWKHAVPRRTTSTRTTRSSSPRAGTPTSSARRTTPR